MTSRLNKKEDSAIIKSALNYDFSIIFSLVLKSFDVPYCEISLFNCQEVYLRSTDQEIDGKNFRYTNTIYEQSILRREIVFATEVNLAYDGNIAFYASAPLFDSLGNVFGALIILDHKSRDFTNTDCGLLTSLANLVQSTLRQNLGTMRLKEVYTDFLHKAVHDLKNPLTSVSLTSELLKRKATDPKIVVNFAERIEKSNIRLLNNLAHIKSVFPHYSDGFRLAITDIDLKVLLEDIKNSIININITIENTLSSKIVGDYERLKEAILLLISHMSLSKVENVTIKYYRVMNEMVLEISSTKLSYEHHVPTKSSTPLLIAEILIVLQEGTLIQKLIDVQNNYSFYVSFPLIVL